MKKQALIIFFSFIVGFIAAPTKITKVEDIKLNDWRQLKYVDDKAISIASDVMNQCSIVLVAVANGDLDTMLSSNKRMDILQEQLPDITNERMTILKKL